MHLFDVVGEEGDLKPRISLRTCEMLVEQLIQMWQVSPLPHVLRRGPSNRERWGKLDLAKLAC